MQDYGKFKLDEKEGSSNYKYVKSVDFRVVRDASSSI